MKNVSFKVVGNYLICAYNEFPPTEEDAKMSLDIFRSLDLEKVKVLTFTKGGAPTAAQRKNINDVLDGRTLTTAVVSDSPLVRGIITAFSWFNARIRAFPRSSMEDAFRYLEIPPSRYDFFADEAAKVQAEVSKPQRSAAAGIKRA